MAAKKPKEDAGAESKKMHDVAKPGTTPPSATSRPIIVTNRPILQDPMVNESTAPTEQASADPAAKPSAAKLTIRPITVASDDEETDGEITVNKSAKADTAALPESPTPTESEDSTEAPVPPAKDKDTEVVPAKAESKAATDEPTEPGPAEDAAPEPSAPTDETSEDKSTDESDSEEAPATPQSPQEIEAASQAAEQEAAEHAAAIVQLAESKQYYLPIATAEQRKTKQFILLGGVLIVVLGLAWLDVALDAGLVHITGVKPVTHFFTK